MSLFIFAEGACQNANANGYITGIDLPHSCADKGQLSTLFLLGFAIIGGLAFLFLVLAGTRYILARGNPEAISKAKNQIQYSLIGLVIAGMAAAIVNFVIGKL